MATVHTFNLKRSEMRAENRKEKDGIVGCMGCKYSWIEGAVSRVSRCSTSCFRRHLRMSSLIEKLDIVLQDLRGPGQKRRVIDASRKTALVKS
eukprot:5782063-Amphidinium_carterae.1